MALDAEAALAAGPGHSRPSAAARARVHTRSAYRLAGHPIRCESLNARAVGCHAPARLRDQGLALIRAAELTRVPVFHALRFSGTMTRPTKRRDRSHRP